MSNEIHSNKKAITMDAKNIEQYQNQSMARLKYDDADLCSKRRKSLPSQEISEDCSEYIQFAHEANKPYLNSTVLEENGIIINIMESEQDLCALNEARRKFSRSLSTITELDGEIHHDNKSLTISTNPANSSKGFDNTFNLLENQVEKGFLKSRSFKENLNKTKIGCQIDSFQIETRFELELLARERLELLWHEIDSMIPAQQKILCSKDKEIIGNYLPASTLLSFLYDFCINNEEEFIKKSQTYAQQCKYERLQNLCKLQQEKEQLQYHASLDADGEKCLRVMRNPKALHDKGMNDYFSKDKTLHLLQLLLLHYK